MNLLAVMIENIVRSEGKKFLDLDFIDQSLNLTKFLSPENVHSLYVHIPFCTVLCPYCSFNRYTYEESLSHLYFKALIQELSQYKEKGFSFTRLYVGGGTPTVNMDELALLLEELKCLFPIRQISVETNPSDITIENAERLKYMGVNRLSIGVQTFQDKLLIDIGRTSHSSKTAIDAIQIASSRFETLNVDLMFNFPTQTKEDLLDDIRLVQALPANQITYYPLMPSPHRKTKMEQQFRTVSPRREFTFYQLIVNKMLPDYSLSTAWCFSKGDRIIDEYIVEDLDYIGAGAGAVSFIKGNFLVNTFSPQKFIELIHRNKLPAVLYKKSTIPEEARYYMLTRLFGMKMPVEEYRQKYRNTLWKELALLRSFSLVETKDGYIRPTRKGLYYVGLMMKHFFSSLNWLREYCMENRI